MKRRQALKSLPLAFAPLLASCARGGIFMPEDNQGTNDNTNKNEYYTDTIVSGLKQEPCAIWTPTEKILFCQNPYFKIINQLGSDVADILVIEDGDIQKNLLYPNWVGGDIVYQMNKGNTSAMYVKYSATGDSRKLDFGLPEGNLPQGNFQYPTLSRDGKIAFTYDNLLYASPWPSRFKATNIEIDEKLGKWCRWAGMYDWSRDGKLALAVKTDEYVSNIYVIKGIKLQEDNTLDKKSISVEQLTEGIYLDYNPSWSPDSNYIAFDSNRQGNDFTKNSLRHVFLMKSDGTNLKDITKKVEAYKPGLSLNPYSCISPKFNPNNNQLIYSLNFFGDWTIELVRNSIQ